MGAGEGGGDSSRFRKMAGSLTPRTPDKLLIGLAQLRRRLVIELGGALDARSGYFGKPALCARIAS